MDPRRGSGRATYSAKTINNTLTTLSGILGPAVNDGLLRQNPARRQGGAGERRMRVREEFSQVAYLKPLNLAGLRISEALALEPRDIARDDGVITVACQLKNGAGSQLKGSYMDRTTIARRRREPVLRDAASTCTYAQEARR